MSESAESIREAIRRAQPDDQAVAVLLAVEQQLEAALRLVRLLTTSARGPAPGPGPGPGPGSEPAVIVVETMGGARTQVPLEAEAPPGP